MAIYSPTTGPWRPSCAGTADAYIESLVEEIGKNDQVKVATSDGLIQLSSLRSGVLRVSAREMEEEVRRAKTEMRKLYGRK